MSRDNFFKLDMEHLFVRKTEPPCSLFQAVSKGNKKGVSVKPPEAAHVPEHSCPRCHLVMNKVTFRRWTIQLCPRCEGTFYKASILAELVLQPDLGLSNLRAALLPNLASPHPDELERNRIDCPECKTLMIRETYSEESSVFVDRCPNGHGTWLDDGELGMLVKETLLAHPLPEPSFWESIRRLLGFVPNLPEEL